MEGGALSVTTSADVTVSRCMIVDNSAPGWKGGGVFVHGATLTVDHTVVARNTSPNGSGLFLSDSCTVGLTNCTVTANGPGESGGGIYAWCYSTLVCANSIIWGNEGSSIYQKVLSDIEICYSDIKGGWRGTGNIDAAPLFIDAGRSNFGLAEDSPCIDAGDPASPIDPDSSRADMGAFAFTHPDTIDTTTTALEHRADRCEDVLSAPKRAEPVQSGDQDSV